MPQRKCLTKFNSEQRGTLQQGIGPLCSHTFHGSLLPPGKNPTTQFGIQGLYGVWPQLLASEINPSPNSAFLYRFQDFLCGWSQDTTIICSVEATSWSLHLLCWYFLSPLTILTSNFTAQLESKPY